MTPLAAIPLTIGFLALLLLARSWSLDGKPKPPPKKKMPIVEKFTATPMISGAEVALDMLRKKKGSLPKTALDEELERRGAILRARQDAWFKKQESKS